MSKKPWNVMSNSDINTYQRNKFAAETKGDPDGRLHSENEGLRKKYGISSDDYGYSDIQSARAFGANAYDNAAAGSLNYAAKLKRYNDPYAKELYNLYDEIKNFTYNPEKDEMFDAYKKAYNRESASAQDKVYSNLTALSGGRNNSWASAAVAQTANSYAQKLSDKIPELAQNAYNRLLQEYNILNGISNKGISANAAEYENAMQEYDANVVAADSVRKAAKDELESYYDLLDYNENVKNNSANNAYKAQQTSNARLDGIRTMQEIEAANIELKYLDENERIKLILGQLDIDAARALVAKRRAETAKIYSKM